jgi:hypothetical protein
MVSMEARSARRTTAPADRQALLDHHATARTDLARDRRIDRYDLSTGACSLESEESQKRRPPRIADALGQVVVLHQIGRLQAFMIDHIVGARQRTV